MNATIHKYREPIPRTLLMVMAVSACLFTSIAVGREIAAIGDAAKSETQWIRPGFDHETRPMWGHRDGIRIGLAPLPGPRGLLRVYTPYLQQPDERPLNYLAVEPIPHGEVNRGLSELEFSRLDNRPGKRFQAIDELGQIHTDTSDLPRGNTSRRDAIDYLEVFVLVEPFDNGAHVYLKLIFRADRPHEVGIATYTEKDSCELDYCIVTATMGNYARIRELELATKIATAQELWPEYRGTEFTPHARFELAQLKRLESGGVLVTARPDEVTPPNAGYEAGTRRNWKYVGDSATQSWRVEDPDPKLAAQVNGRRVYWRSESKIPGGIAFENFELVSPFKSGAEFWFSVDPIAKPDPQTPQ